MFVVGCLVTALICLVSTYSRRLKQLIYLRYRRPVYAEEVPDTDRRRINSESVSEEKAAVLERPLSLKLILLVYFLYYSLMHILVMLLIMTMNGYVVLAVIGGQTIGYVLFEEPM